ncbi:MAG: CPBP family intramembrane glutamic endopeptidase [Bacteroidota bacterium]
MEPAQQRSSWTNAVLIMLVALLGFLIIGPTIGAFLAYPLYEGTPFSFAEDLTNPLGKPQMKVPLFILQGAATFFGLAAIPAFYYFKKYRKNPFQLIGSATMLSLLAVAGIVIFFMGFNSMFIEWNAKLNLPDFMAGFESWAREKEDIAMALTQYLTQFDSFGQFVLGFVVIAILPAIGEELVFRGMLQPELHRATGSIHAAIWISAALFSALHMQFFGFVPRMLLGALFGYLYYWSGNLLIPVVAHFVNNGFSVLMIYLNKTDIAGVDLENPETAPWPVVVAFSALAFALLYYFRKTELEKTTP